jgi:hypothetical protein
VHVDPSQGNAPKKKKKKKKTLLHPPNRNSPPPPAAGSPSDFQSAAGQRFSTKKSNLAKELRTHSPTFIAVQEQRPE